jgi:DNA polymerase-3 subunit alpha
VDERTLRCGLGIITNVGLGAVESIIQARQTAGRFTSIEQLCENIDLRLTNRKVLESLIKAGACDDVGRSRAGMMAKLDQALEEAAVRQRDKQRGQFTFFETLTAPSTPQPAAGEPAAAPAPKARDWPESQKLAFEKELLGFYVSGHPLSRYERTLRTLSTTSSQGMRQQAEGTVVRMGGMFSQVKPTTTKKTNEQMAICVLEDLEGDVEVLVFPGVYPQVAQHLKPSSIVFVEGRVGRREDTPKLLAQQIVPYEEAMGRLSKSIELIVPATLERPGLERLKELLSRFAGMLPIYLTLQVPGQAPVRLKLAEGFKIDPRPELVAELERLLGPDAVVVTPKPPAPPERLDKPWQRVVKGNSLNGTD